MNLAELQRELNELGELEVSDTQFRAWLESFWNCQLGIPPQYGALIAWRALEILEAKLGPSSIDNG